MRQETVTELRDRSVLMDAFKKTKVGYFTEFYKWNRCLATILGVVIFILFVIVTSLLFIFNEAATRIEYVCQNLSLSIIFLSVLIHTYWLYKLAYKKESTRDCQCLQFQSGRD